MILSVLLGTIRVTAEFAGTIAHPNGKPAANAVVWLDGKLKSQPLKKAVINQRDRTFTPHISVVTVGTEIEFPNNDTVFHNVFAAFEAKKFGLGMYPRGKTKVQQFTKPGVVALMCSIHSEMSAFVVIVDTPYYAVSDSKGRFQIKGVVAGDYSAKCWHENGETSRMQVSVPDSNRFELRLLRS